MYKSLMADMVGIDADPLGIIDYAKRYGFAGVDLRLDKQAERINTLGEQRVLEAMGEAGLLPGYCSILPGKVSCDESAWREGVAKLPDLAALAERLGYTRTASVVLPFDDALPFDRFFDLHVKRIKAVAPVLADHGLSLALEYVSPVTRRAGHKHPFVHDLNGLRSLYRAAEHANVGILLDSFHWHCACETTADIEALSGDEVVVVHVNDLPADRPIDEQLVTERALPCETGVIDLSGFMIALEHIGYDGPVTAEPTHPKWANTQPDQAAEKLAESMDRLMGLVSTV